MYTKKLPKDLLKKIEENKKQIAEHVRNSIKATLTRWDNDRDIELLLDVEVSLRDGVEDYAVICDTHADVDRLSDDKMIDLVVENIRSVGEQYDEDVINAPSC